MTGLLALASVTWVLGGGPAAAAPRASRPAASSSWTVYHGDAAGRGVAGPVAAVNTTTRAWTSPALDGQIYAEPLVSSGRVYVATEDDTVYELSAATGAVVWSTHLGSPVPSTDLPCGNITPTVGITGTPVIDQSRGEIFVVADELVNGKPAHMFTGLATASGKVEVTQDVDPAGVDTAALLQRTGLTLDDGQVVFGMGGNYGDCAAYRGRLIAVPETGGTPKMFTVDAAAGESQGAIWMGGAAPVVDSSGNIWVSTGNGSVYSYSHAYDNSDSVLELSPSLKLLQFFAPTTWATNNSQDLDMSTAPALLSDGQVILTGKSGIVYLLNGAHLGGIGGQQASPGLGVQPGHRRWRRGAGHDGLPALRQRHHRGSGGEVPGRASPAVEFRDGRRPRHRGCGPGLDHRAERHAVRAEPGHRPGAAAGIDRRARQPFPDSERGRRPAAGPLGGSGGRLHRLCPRFGHRAHADPEHRVPVPASRASSPPAAAAVAAVSRQAPSPASSSPASW